MSSVPLLPGDAEFQIDYPSGNISEHLSKPRPADAAFLIVGELSLLRSKGLAQHVSLVSESVTPELFESAVDQLSPGEYFGDACSVLLKTVTVAALPTLASRHNASGLPHSVKAAVDKAPRSRHRVVLVVCGADSLYASGCAVPRSFPRYSQKGSVQSVDTVEVLFYRTDQSQPEQGLSDQEAFAFSISGQCIRMTQSIVDRPCNLMHTDAFVEQAQNVAQFLGCGITVIRGEDLDAKGFGGIYGVGKAAVHPPALVVLSHTPAGAQNTIAWVGKGIVYDTGGLSLKPKGFMAGMKRDCGGAAGILGAFTAAVKLGFKDNLHCLLCLAENAIGPVATRPDDVHVMLSGRSVEINNPDAEGRLVLADGVNYAATVLNAGVVLDMATLTGAQGIATGRYHGALLANNEDWQDATRQAGRCSGDLVFPVPFTPELHMPEFASAIADMKNSVERRDNAQPSCAGLFIHSHLPKSYAGAWIHVDMAGPVHQGERATGYGVGLLVSLFGSRLENPILHSLAPSLPDSQNGEPPAKRSRS